MCLLDAAAAAVERRTAVGVALGRRTAAVVVVVAAVVDAITASVKSVEVLDTTVDLLVSVVNRSSMTPL